MRRITLRDIAREANVSTSTVSLHLRGLSGVGEEVGARIDAAVTKLGYQPRNTEKETPRRLVGLIVERLPLPVLSDLFYAEVMYGVQEQAALLGYSVIFSTVDGQNLLSGVADGQAEGWLILGSGSITDEEILAVHDKGIPFVLVDNYSRGLQVPAVVPDNVSGGYQAVQHLVELGHKKIAVLAGPEKYKTLTDRLHGARLAANDAGLDAEHFFVQPALSSGRPKKGYLELEAVFSTGFRPTAVFAVSDKTAFGAYDAARDAGLKIPDDLSIIGFDDLTNSLHAEPPLTTIHIPKRDFGIVAMQNLVGIIDNRESIATKTLIYTSLLVRESTAPPRSTGVGLGNRAASVPSHLDGHRANEA